MTPAALLEGIYSQGHHCSSRGWLNPSDKSNPASYCGKLQA